MTLFLGVCLLTSLVVNLVLVAALRIMDADDQELYESLEAELRQLRKEQSDASET